MESGKTIVLKVGTSSLVDTRTGITQVSALARLAEVSMRLVKSGYQVILVSSGAVGLGCSRLGLKTRPTTVAGKQAAAAVGQVCLMSLYDDVFSVLGLRCAQVLLTYDSFGDRTQYLNARNTFSELLRLGVIPVVNENDTIATQEIRVGDNDTLSALVAAMVGAQWLMLLTDVEALFDANPRDVPSATPIRAVPTHFIQNLRKQMGLGLAKMVVGPYSESLDDAAAPAASDSPAPAGGRAGSQWGTGGMATKLKAAQLATAAGVSVLITCTANIEKVEGVLSTISPASLAPPSDHAGAPSSSSSTSAAGKDSHRSRSSSPQRPPGLQQAPHSPGRAPGLGAAGADALQPAVSTAATTTSTTGTPAREAGGGELTNHAWQHVFIDAGMGTTFLPAPKPVTGRKKWILSLAPQGSLTLDEGAVSAVRDARKSLFPAGVKDVSGEFDAQDAVVLLSHDGVEVARALVNYPSHECRKLAGRRSREVVEVLGFLGPEALAERDNIVVLHGDKGPALRLRDM